jgi:hypothetical protein
MRPVAMRAAVEFVFFTSSVVLLGRVVPAGICTTPLPFHKGIIAVVR